MGKDHIICSFLGKLEIVYKLFPKKLIRSIPQLQQNFLGDRKVNLVHIYYILIYLSLPKLSLVIYLLECGIVFSFLVELGGLRDIEDLLLAYDIIYKLLISHFLFASHATHSFP